MNGKLTSIARGVAYSLILIALTMFLSLPAGVSNVSSAEAMFCACCADAGDWYQRAEKIDADMQKEISRVKFSEATNTSRDTDGEVFLDGKFELSQSKDSRHWQLRLGGSQGKSGALSLRIPLRLVSFGADVHDGQEGGGGGPLLYKEWRFEGPVTGTGVFKSWKGTAAKFHLVLQGRGNHCTQAEDFKHWILYVNNGPTSLSFYGSISK
jgi:hypothetical protein